MAHYPWFVSYNVLHASLFIPSEKLGQIIRSAFIGFVSSTTSDICANPARVMKTIKQTSGISDTRSMGYIDAWQITFKDRNLREVLKQLFLRGLFARIITNGLQSMIFTIFLINSYK